MIYRSMLSVETISRHSVDILTNLSSADTILDILANSYRSSVGISIHALGLEYLFTNIPTQLNTLDCYTQQNCRHFMAIHYLCHRAGEKMSCKSCIYLPHQTKSQFSNFWYKITLQSFFKIHTYHQDLWGISANVNNYLGLFATHYFTNFTLPIATQDLCNNKKTSGQFQEPRSIVPPPF